MTQSLIQFVAAISLLMSGDFAIGADERHESTMMFREQVLPIFKARCVKCHGARSAKAELDLSSALGVVRGGESGPVVDHDSLDHSRLLEVIVDGEMPPEDAPQLSAQQKGEIAKWIKSGGKTGAESEARRVSLADVLPIMQLRCVVCHGSRSVEAGLDLRTYASLMHGGKSGQVVVPGKPKDSALLKRIHSGEMPPKRKLVQVSVKPIEANELATLTSWIQQGAKPESLVEDVATNEADALVTDADRDFWSFGTPRRPGVPDVKSVEQVRTPIDRFILRRLEMRGLHLAQPADQHTLIRRLFIDLLGLPPTPEQVDDFVQDARPDAWERLVERTLASPHYGERWGGYWLDLAGYSDSEGISHSDPVRPHAWRYRDYVIRSFNQNRPYDEFVRQQIAGDELVDYSDPDAIASDAYDSLVATGFLRMPEDGTFAGVTGYVPDRLEIIDDTLEVFSSAMLGLTVRCARCHSHKFDPIPQRDYYRLAAAFKGALDEHDWLPPKQGDNFKVSADHIRLLPTVSTQERREWQQHEDNITARITSLRKQLDSGKAKLSDAEFKAAQQRTEAEVKRLESTRRPQPMIRALWDRGRPSPTYILRRGNYLTPGRLVGPGVPSVLTDGRSRFKIEKRDKDAPGTGRRLALARWLTDPTHPLTARVFVNRVWRHHFERGIVETLDDFGKAGARPTHPDLLDWLAIEFIESGWDIKSLHRLILTSTVYQQSSTVSDAAADRDPENRLLSRMPLRRLNAEALRDSLLCIAGRLNESFYGEPRPVKVHGDGLVTSVPENNLWRRSIYVRKRRSEQVSILANFDRPKMSPNCVDRSQSTVAPQALHLMNNAMVRELAESLARRVIEDVADGQDARIRRLYQVAIGRQPAEDELHEARSLLTKFEDAWKLAGNTDHANRATTSLSHALINSAAFLYVD